MTWREIYELYQLTSAENAPNLRTHSNICPTDQILIVRDRQGQREAAMVRWGLVPSEWPALNPKYTNHNARSDKVLKTSWWRKPLEEGRRCLIPASGFYEWKTEGEGRRAKKTRFYITSKSGSPLTFAGLWEHNEKLSITSVTMICTEPNELMARIHDRMPVILDAQDWASWLAEPRIDPLKPAPLDDLVAYPVRSKIEDDDPTESLAPVALL